MYYEYNDIYSSPKLRRLLDIVLSLPFLFSPWVSDFIENLEIFMYIMLRNLNCVNPILSIGNLSLKFAKPLASLSATQSGTLRKDNQVYSPLLEFVRYRKPVYCHIAGTKLHKVTIRKPLLKEDDLELIQRTRTYRTLMRSIRGVFKKERMRILKKQKSQEVDNAVDLSKMEFIEKTNNEWNKISAEFRIQYEKEEILQKKMKLADLKKDIEDAKEARRAEAKKHLEQIQHESLSFIDMSRLDEAIEESLNQRSTFNFFINKDGKTFIENLDGTVTELDKNGNPVETSIKTVSKSEGAPIEDETTTSEEHEASEGEPAEDSSQKSELHK